jgi:hypothetical protein
MTTAYRPEEVRQILTNRIADLAVVSSYRQGDGDRWQEATEPLVPEWEPATRAHLSFFVDDRDLLDTQRTRSTIDDQPLVQAPMVIRFLYRVRPLRPTALDDRPKVADWDRAALAGRHLLRELLSTSADAGGDSDDEGEADGWTADINIIADPRPMARLPVGTDDQFLVCEVRVRVNYVLSLAVAT